MTTPASSPMPHTAQLDVLVARAQRRAVVFRRGPSKMVLVLAWDLRTDTIVPGQWFRGILRPRWGDLSPNGEYLVVFAASHRPPFHTWTAVSRPPFLTALALWPVGHTWWGGGLFTRANRLDLFHLRGEDGRAPAPATGFAVPGWLEVRAVDTSSGEGMSVEEMRLRRDGWTVEEKPEPDNGYAKRMFRPAVEAPAVLRRPLEGGAVLEISVESVRRRGGRQERRTATVILGGVRRDLGRVDWADADGRDLLYAGDGCLWRLAAADLRGGSARLVADLNHMTFAPVPPPPEALRWSRS